MQCLPTAYHADAAKCIGRFVAAGGSLIVVTAARYDDDPKSNEGRKQLMARAQAAEHKRDELLARYHNFEIASAAFLIGIVLASAEVIAEAPSSRSGVLPLANFGTVNFANATANGVSLASLNPDPISMVSGSTVKAQPGNISSSGSFSVTWKHS